MEPQDAHSDNLQRQAHQHPLINDKAFPSIETYVNHLIHCRAYEEATKLAAGKVVLDFGCNVGYGMQMLASAASSISGVDVSPQAVGAAVERLGPGADIRLYDGVKSSFPEHSFDVVTSFQVIEHVSDYQAYFSEIVRVLRPSGRVLFTTPNRTLRLDPGMKPWNPFHVREFSASELRDLLLQWFTEVEVRGLFGRSGVHEVERMRVDAARARARSPWKKLRRSSSGLLKRFFPQIPAVVTRFRMAAGQTNDRAYIDQSDLDKYSTQDLFYSTDGLDEALDLMAVCRIPRAH
ncbi:MAG TPA: class I SAM-dependent methyltransferase [Gemmatimonadaceae bacterium]|jgi:SAM-dependent methyltransferase